MTLRRKKPINSYLFNSEKYATKVARKRFGKDFLKRYVIALDISTNKYVVIKKKNKHAKKANIPPFTFFWGAPMKHPTIGTTGYIVWKTCGTLSKELNRIPHSNEVIERLKDRGFKVGTIRSHVSKWRKYYNVKAPKHGISKTKPRNVPPPPATKKAKVPPPPPGKNAVPPPPPPAFLENKGD